MFPVIFMELLSLLRRIYGAAVTAKRVYDTIETIQDVKKALYDPVFRTKEGHTFDDRIYIMTMLSITYLKAFATASSKNVTSANAGSTLLVPILREVFYPNHNLLLGRFKQLATTSSLSDVYHCFLALATDMYLATLAPKMDESLMQLAIKEHRGDELEVLISTYAPILLKNDSWNRFVMDLCNASGGPEVTIKTISNTVKLIEKTVHHSVIEGDARLSDLARNRKLSVDFSVYVFSAMALASMRVRESFEHFANPEIPISGTVLASVPPGYALPKLVTLNVIRSQRHKGFFSPVLSLRDDKRSELDTEFIDAKISQFLNSKLKRGDSPLLALSTDDD